jgi:hypothetical protein
MRTACAGVALTPSTGWGVGRWRGLPTGDFARDPAQWNHGFDGEFARSTSPFNYSHKTFPAKSAHAIPSTQTLQHVLHTFYTQSMLQWRRDSRWCASSYSIKFHTKYLKRHWYGEQNQHDE